MNLALWETGMNGILQRKDSSFTHVFVIQVCSREKSCL